MSSFQTKIRIEPIRPQHVDEAKRVIATVVHEIFQGGSADAENADKTLAEYEAQGWLDDVDQYQAVYSDNRGVFLVLMDGQKVAGTGALRLLDESTAELKRMWFLKEYRGKGLGRQMAELLIQFAATHGFKRVRLDTSKKQVHAIKLYKRLGFYHIEKYNNSDTCDVFMEKSLE